MRLAFWKRNVMAALKQRSGDARRPLSGDPLKNIPAYRPTARRTWHRAQLQFCRICSERNGSDQTPQTDYDGSTSSVARMCDENT